MINRQCVDQHVPLGEAPIVDQAERVRCQIVMRQHRALGTAGGAGSIENGCQVVVGAGNGGKLRIGLRGRVDLLVNSAGINVPKRSWADMELEGWDKLVEINLNGVMYCMRAVLPAMRRQQDGCIINVASWAGRHVSKMPGPAYTTTKHAVLALTHSFNMDECVNGLRACCLSPGEVATPILKLRPVVPSEKEQARMLQPEDLGRTIAFVASMPPRVCMNEILISPTWNRGFVQTPASRD
jgi:NAD(P)-dependent dehydrogenase (short-subunit alcohol dehydrogenase family)